jgi:hypothetical protein
VNKISFIFCFLCILGCGVKGRPLAPLVPTPIGRGEPTYSEKNPNKSPIKNKYNYKLEEKNDDIQDSSGE